MKLAVCAILASSAAAFAPASQKSSSKTALNAVIDLSDKVGGLPPLGPWDPLGLEFAEPVDAEGALSALARALDVAVPNRTRPIEALVEALHDRNLLVVIDNFEQMLARVPAPSAPAHGSDMPQAA